MTTERIRLAGIICAIGGALWVIVLLAGAVAHDAVYGNVATYRTWEGLLIVVQGLLLIGMAGLAWSGATGPGWLGRIGLGLALLGRAFFLVGEISSFARGSDDEVFVPLGALLTGLGMVLVGIAVVRARRWEGWHRLIPLLAGLYPFVAMFPFFAIMGTPPAPAIALWGVLWVLLGFALYAETDTAVIARRSAATAVYS